MPVQSKKLDYFNLKGEHKFMTGSSEKKQIYAGFEQGPIRPPSEASSLLIRITRNCPWNRCTFCPVYKNERFSLRPTAHVIKDIDGVSSHINALRKMSGPNGQISRFKINTYIDILLMFTQCCILLPIFKHVGRMHANIT